MVKNLPASAGDIRDPGSIPEAGRSPGVRNDNPLPVFLPEKSLGQRSPEVHGVAKSQRQLKQLSTYSTH